MTHPSLLIFHCSEEVYFDRNRQHPIPEKVLFKRLNCLEFPELDESDRTIIVDEQGKTLATH